MSSGGSSSRRLPPAGRSDFRAWPNVRGFQPSRPAGRSSPGHLRLSPKVTPRPGDEPPLLPERGRGGGEASVVRARALAGWRAASPSGRCRRAWHASAESSPRGILGDVGLGRAAVTDGTAARPSNSPVDAADFVGPSWRSRQLSAKRLAVRMCYSVGKETNSPDGFREM